MLNFYVLAITFIFIHEIDAYRCKEWRIIPGLSFLKDKVGSILFIFLHVPLFYWVLMEIRFDNQTFRKGLDYFLIVHLLLHILFLGHKKNKLKDWISWTIIVGAALFGLLDLLTTPHT